MRAKLLSLFTAIVFSTGVYAQRANPSALQQWDDRVMIDLANSRTPGETGFMRFITNTNKYVDVGVPVGLMAGGLLGHDQQMRQNAVYVATSSAISGILTLAIKQIVKRPRPFVQNINIVPVYRASGYSFPSGHSSSSFTTATSLSIAYPKWYVIAPSFLWAGTVAYSRMYLGVHYPTDVATGTILGAGTAVSMSFMKR